MSKKTILIGLIIMALLGLWLTYYWSDTQVIKRNLVALAVEISKTESETPLQMALKMGKVKDRLLNPCQVTIPDSNYAQAVEIDLIIRYLIYYRQRYPRIDLSFVDVQIDLSTATKAVVDVTCHLRRQQTTDQLDPEPEIHHLQFGLVKEDKKWRIQKVTLPLLLIE